MIKKQALSEYSGIRADLDQQKCQEAGLVYKGGVLVNTETRGKEEWNEIKQRNAKKYSLSQEESDEIIVPSVISADYMKQRCFRRRQSLLLYRAALRAEIARR